MGAPFPAAGDTVIGYFAGFHHIWRAMGWGNPVPGGPNTIVYPYYQAGGSGDTGDVYAVRSIDNGATWSAPIAISTAPHEQWFSQAVSNGYDDLAIWYYSREHTTDGNNYEIFLRKSHDGGATWTASRRLSDVLIDEPVQNDPNVNPFFAGDYNVTTSDVNGALSNRLLITWTDGRNKITGPPGNYDFTATTGTIGSGGTDVGTHCDDCSTALALPFPVHVLRHLLHDRERLLERGDRLRCRDYRLHEPVPALERRRAEDRALLGRSHDPEHRLRLVLDRDGDGADPRLHAPRGRSALQQHHRGPLRGPAARERDEVRDRLRHARERRQLGDRRRRERRPREADRVQLTRRAHERARGERRVQAERVERHQRPHRGRRVRPGAARGEDHGQEDARADGGLRTVHLLVGSTVVASAAANGGSGTTTVAPGTFTVKENASSGSLANYVTTIACTKNGQADVSGTGTSIAVTVAGDDVEVCTITNKRKATITLRKSLSPTSDTGKFNLIAGTRRSPPASETAVPARARSPPPRTR